MATIKNSYVIYIEDILSSLYPISMRAMFGGVGIYYSGLMVALVAQEELYFKADDETASFFKSHGSVPFTYQSRGKSIALSYWKVPTEVLEQSDQLREWFSKAITSAQRVSKKVK
jgi:DNA transformation protein and related proteins